jgi:hypothetical protein
LHTIDNIARGKRAITRVRTKGYLKYVGRTGTLG